MKKVQVLGTGCPKCKELAGRVCQAIEKSEADYELVKVTDINDIMAFGVMLTPALAIDGDVKFVGKVPSVEEIIAVL